MHHGDWFVCNSGYRCICGVYHPAFTWSSSGGSIGHGGIITAPDTHDLRGHIACCNLHIFTRHLCISVHVMYLCLDRAPWFESPQIAVPRDCQQDRGATSIILGCIVELAQCRAIAAPRNGCCSTVRPCTGLLYPIAGCSSVS